MNCKIQNPVVFLYTNYKLPEREINKTPYSQKHQQE